MMMINSNLKSLKQRVFWVEFSLFFGNNWKQLQGIFQL